jgi:hypothetical protein
MATADQYAAWIVANASKQGTPEFETVAAAYQEAKAEEGAAAPPAPEKSGFFGSIADTAGTLGSGLSAIGFAGAETPEEQAQARQKLIDDETPEGIGTAFADIKDASSAWDWFKQTAGSSLGFLVAPGVAATAAGVAKLPFLPAKAVGYGVLGAQYLITNLTRQAQEQKAAIEAGESPNTTSLGKAIIASAAQTGLDVLQFGTVFKPIVSKFPVLGKLVGNEGAEVAKRTEKELIKALEAGEFSVSGGIARGILGGAAFEIPQEIAQQMLERWQSDQPLTGEDAAQEYLEAGVGALALGGSMGALSGFIDTASQRAEAQQAKDDEFAGAQEEYNKEKDEAQRLAQEEADRQAELNALSKDAPEGQLKGTEALAKLFEDAKAFAATLPEGYEADWKEALNKQFPNLEPGYDNWLLKQFTEKDVAYKDRSGVWTQGKKVPKDQQAPKLELPKENYLDLQQKAMEFLKTLPPETEKDQWKKALTKEFNLYRNKYYPEQFLKDAVNNLPDLFHRTGSDETLLYGQGPKPKTSAFKARKDLLVDAYKKVIASAPLSERGFHKTELKKLSGAPSVAALDKAETELKPTIDKYTGYVVDAQKARNETTKKLDALVRRNQKDKDFAAALGPKVKELVGKVTPLYRGTGGTDALMWTVDEDTAHREIAETELPALEQAVTAYDAKAKTDAEAAKTAAKAKKEADAAAAKAAKEAERTAAKTAAEQGKAASKAKTETDKAAAKAQRDTRQQTAVTNVLTAFTSNPEFADRSKAIPLTATKIAEITGLNRMTEAPAVLSALHKAGHIEKSTAGKGYSIPANKKGKPNAGSVNPDNGANGAATGAGTTRTARKKRAAKQGTQEAGTAGVDATVASATGADAGKAADGSPLKPPKPPKPPKPSQARTAEDITKEAGELFSQGHINPQEAKRAEKLINEGELDKAETIVGMARKAREVAEKAKAETAAEETTAEKTVEPKEDLEAKKAANEVAKRKAEIAEQQRKAAEREEEEGDGRLLADTTRDRASDAEIMTIERSVDKSMGDLGIFLNRLAESTPEKLYKYLSEVLSDRVRELQKLGVRMEVEITDTIRDKGKNLKTAKGVSRAYTSSIDRGVVTRINVELRTNANDAITSKEGVGADGRNYLTALHESVHAVTQGFFSAPNYMLSEKTLEAKQELKAVLKKAKAAVQRLATSSRRTRNQLTATEEAAVYLYEKTNAFADIDELVTQTLTNYDMQRFLNDIKYPAKGGWRTLFNDFIAAIKNLIGFKINDDSALLAVIKATSVVMEADVTEGYASYALYSNEGNVTPLRVLQSQQKSSKRTKKVFSPPPIRKESHQERVRRKMGQTDARAQREEGVREAGKALMTEKGFEEVVRKFQNDRRPLKQLQDFLEKAKKLVVTGDFNNLYDHITLSTGKAFNAMTEHLQGHMASLDRAVLKYAEARGISTNLALAYLQTYYEAKHEPERRLTKFMMNVPLNTKTITQLDQTIIPQQSPLYNVKASAAELRERIIAELSTNKNLVSNGYAEKYREALNELIRRNPKVVTRADGSTYEVGEFMDNTVDGATTVKDRGVVVTNMSFDPFDRVYDVIGAYSQEQLQEDRDAYEKDPHKGMVDKIYKQMGFLQNATIRLDKESNYWSKPVDNIKEFYGWDYYIPMKGQGEKNAFVHASDARFEYNSRRLGAGFNDLGGEFGGRSTDSYNPVLQTMVDATKSALRYGRKDVTIALKNLIKEKHIKGRLFASISFRDRYRSELAFDPTSDKFFFVYKPDGMIDIYEVTDDRMKEAIRRSYTDQQPLVNLANNITGAIGHLHTRYNISFHPYNFVRDALTNAFTMGAEMGPLKAAKLIQAVAVRVGQSGAMSKAMKVSRLYAAGKVGEIRTMAKTDNFVKEVLEYLEEGGRISYIQGLSNKSQAQEMLKDIERGDFSRHKEVFDKWVDTWGDGFEFTSRAASYAVMKSEYMAQGMTEAEARTRAASYTKNLANFEQVGQYGRSMGAMYMFFRPAITGAVRAIDALKPAFQSVDSFLDSVPESLRGDAEAMENLRKDHLAKQKNARHMIYSLLGMGATLYLMAMLASDDDEQGRNKTQIDDMALWTRNIRLPLDIFGDKDSYLQLPWGFGLGAFGAMGAQVAGVAFGKTSIMEAMPNFISIALDSYMPIPFQRIDPTENFSAFAVGSMAPSLARPFLEWSMNVDSLGREIYNNRLNKYGDAFTGGANVPEAYRDLSRWLLKKSNVGIDVQPTTLQFWGNQYADGIARIGHALYGLNQYFSGTKDLDVKADIPLVSSFIGRKSNYDGREFASVEKQLKEESARLSSLEFQPELRRRYVEDHPYMPAVVNHFNKISNNQLKDIRSLRKDIEASDLPANVRKERLDALRINENYVKRNLINMYRQYGVEP